MMPRALAVLASVALLVVASAGASGPGSIPVTTVKIPARTVVYTEESSAMEPTIHCAKPLVGCLAARPDRILVQEPAPPVKRYDVIVFNAPPRAVIDCGARGLYVQRVVGMPGDTWADKSGIIYINGKKLDEPYIENIYRDNFSFPSQKIPPGRYFTMGDNRSGSCDSRRFGAVPNRDIVGKVTRIERAG